MWSKPLSKSLRTTTLLHPAGRLVTLYHPVETEGSSRACNRSFPSSSAPALLAMAPFGSQNCSSSSSSSLPGARQQSRASRALVCIYYS